MQVLALSQLCLIATEDDDWETGMRLIAHAREQVSRCGLIDYPSIVMVKGVSAMVAAHEGQMGQAKSDLGNAQRLMSELAAFPPWYEAQVRLALFRTCARLDDLETGRALLEEASRALELTPDAIILKGWMKESLPP
jgi:hypothetical protein